nr:DUF4328 domain-containing protein [Streptomyces sp. HNM0574]
MLSAPLVAAWLTWFWRVRTNAEALAPGRVRYPAGMAIGAWFIPVCCWWFPKQIINDVWRASSQDLDARAPSPFGGPQPVTGRTLTNAWWTLWVLFFTLRVFGQWGAWYQSPLYDAGSSVGGDLVLDLLGFPLGIVALMLVQRLGRRQRQALAAAGA